MEAKQKKLNSSHGPYIVKLESMNALQKHLFMKKYSNSYILQKIVYFLKKKIRIRLKCYTPRYICIQNNKHTELHVHFTKNA